MPVVLVVAGVLVGVFCRREPEPEYGGKRLSECVMAYADCIGKREREFAPRTYRDGGTGLRLKAEMKGIETERFADRKMDTKFTGMGLNRS